MGSNAFDRAKKFAEDNKQRMEDSIRGKYRGLIVMSGEPARLRFLHEPDRAAAPLWVHYWAGKNGARAICSEAHYGEECAICQMDNSFGEGKCYAKMVKCFLGYVYSNLGKTWTPKRGKNKGKKQPVDPYCIIDIPAGGQNKPNWIALDKAVTDGYFDDDDFIWQLDKVEGSPLSPPSIIPMKALGKNITHPSKEKLKEIHSYTDEQLLAHILASFSNVRWDLFELEQPAVEKGSHDDDSDDDDDEDEKPTKSKSTGISRRAVQEDDDEEEEKPAKKKAKLPVDEEDEDEAPPPKKSKKVVVEEDDEEEEAPPPKKSKKAVVEDDEDEDELPPPKKRKAVAARDEEEEELPVKAPEKSKKETFVAEEDELPGPKRRKKEAAAIPPEEEDDEEDAPPPPKTKSTTKKVEDEDDVPPPKKKKAVVVEEEEDDDPPPPKKKKVVVEEDDDDEDDYVPPPKKKKDKLAVG